MPNNSATGQGADYYAGAPDEEICEIVVTAPDPEWLADFTREVIAARLAASAHLIPEVRSLYRWQGDIVDTTEARVSIRAPRSCFAAIAERVLGQHPYEEPSVCMLPIVATTPGYRGWLLGETIAPI